MTKRKELAGNIQKRKKHFWISALLVVLGTIAGVFLLSGSDRLSYAFFDAFQKHTALNQQNEVALVVVDQDTLDSLARDDGLVFPFPRQIFGALAQVAAHYSARLVVYDILFTEPSSYGVDDDRMFVQLLKDANVGVFFPAASPDGLTKAPIPELSGIAAGLGSVNSENDTDGVFRRYLPGQSLANEVFKKLRPNDVLNPPYYLRYYSKESFPTSSLYNVLKVYRDLQENKSPSVDLSALTGKIWVVGYTATSLYDLKSTSLDSKAPGMIIPATAIANVLRHEGLQRFPLLNGIFLCFLFSFLSLLVVKVQKVPWSGLLGLVSVTLLGTVAVSFAHWTSGRWLSPVPLMLSAFSSGFLTLIWTFQTVWRDQLRLAGMVQHSMSPEMVELIRRGDVDVSRFGELRDVTVMFSDLVGFTEMSEKLSPEQLVEVLNGYFDEVVNLVTGCSGYVDKFIGDAVMAVWGAPIKQDNHAQLALNAAIQFQKAVENYNQKLRQKNPNLNELGVRVGVHTGVAVVGNIGARHRHNYTVIGDTVNLSSRLESLCKAYGVQIIMSEETVTSAQAKNFPGVLELDRVIVKGKTSPTRIYTYIDPEAGLKTENYALGLKSYFQGHWQVALSHFETIDFSPAQLMAERCRTALAHGRLEPWKDGVWVYDSK